MIDQDIVAAIKNRPQSHRLRVREPQRTPEPVEMPDPRVPFISSREIKKLSRDQWFAAHLAMTTALEDHLTQMQQRDDGTETAARLIDQTLSLIGWGTLLHASSAPQKGRVWREKVDEVALVLWQSMDRAVQENAEEEVEAERAQVVQGIDAAQAEASQARRDLERERAAWQVEKDHLLAQIKHGEQQLGKLRYDTDKRTQRLEADARDVPRLQGLVGDLDRQVLALKEEKRALCTEFAAREDELLAELDALTHPSGPAPLPPTPISQEESAMTQTASLNAHLAAMSLAVFLRGQGLNVCSEGARVMGEESPRRTGLEAEWASAYPTDAARLAHLREVAAPFRQLLSSGQAA